jgi:6-phosphogluconolactonase
MITATHRIAAGRLARLRAGLLASPGAESGFRSGSRAMNKEGTMLRTSLALLLIAGACLGQARAETFVYVSNAEDSNISIFRMDRESGALQAAGRAEAGKTVMPMAVSPDRRRLYAAVRSAPFSVITYAIAPDSGQLTRLSTVPLPESMPYISVDHTGRFLFGASYGGDMVSVTPLGPDGFAQGEPTQVIRTGRHAHAVLADPSNRYVFATNLGNDQILQFVFDERTGQLTPNRPAAVMAPPGAGPRHFVFAPNNRFVFALNELSGTVTTYAFDPASGLLAQQGSVSAVPRDAKLEPGSARPPVVAGAAGQVEDKPTVWAADLQVTPDGRFLYASERTTSTLARFAVDTITGKLSYLDSTPTETQPRGFRIDSQGRFLVTSGEKSDQISVYAIDPANGALRLLQRYPVGRGANWVNIVETR